jgi:predicted O-methyltransferase YrrM
MHSLPILVYKYFRFYLTASGRKGHGIHSPFVFHFITKVLNNKNRFPEYSVIEGLRKNLIEDKSAITIEDYGAGSAISDKKVRTVSSIAKNAAKSKKFGQLLFRIVRIFQPVTIVELGTSLGITTAYMAKAKPDAEIFTLEGAPQIAQIARNNFERLKLQHINLIEGNFDQTLVKVLNEVQSVDFVFIDGNHRKEPTLRYFELLLTKKNNDTIFVFDDVHWSEEMEAAWDIIKQNAEVKCTIDLFFIGIVFFRKEMMEKQHFAIRF